MPKQKNKSLRSQLATCTAKICSYMEVGKIPEARQWATILQQKFIELNLLIDNPPRTGHNRPQSENKTTIKWPTNRIVKFSRRPHHGVSTDSLVRSYATTTIYKWGKSNGND